jgi:tRNA(fMet)-specific endonuclease VapC
MPIRWMLDTNTVSSILKAHPGALGRLSRAAMTDVSISVITEGELRFGLAKRPAAARLHHIVLEFLSRVEIMAWDSAAAAAYGALRARLEGVGKRVGALDLLIAAHALSLGCTLATSDGGFEKIDQLKVEDWTR